MMLPIAVWKMGVYPGKMCDFTGEHGAFFFLGKTMILPRETGDFTREHGECT